MRSPFCNTDTQLTQQELPACKPVLDATWVSEHQWLQCRGAQHASSTPSS